MYITSALTSQCSRVRCAVYPTLVLTVRFELPTQVHSPGVGYSGLMRVIPALGLCRLGNVSQTRTHDALLRHRVRSRSRFAARASGSLVRGFPDRGKPGRRDRHDKNSHVTSNSLACIPAGTYNFQFHAIASDNGHEPHPGWTLGRARSGYVYINYGDHGYHASHTRQNPKHGVSKGIAIPLL